MALSSFPLSLHFFSDGSGRRRRRRVALFLHLSVAFRTRSYLPARVSSLFQNGGSCDVQLHLTVVLRSKKRARAAVSLLPCHPCRPPPQSRCLFMRLPRSLARSPRSLGLALSLAHSRASPAPTGPSLTFRPSRLANPSSFSTFKAELVSSAATA